MKVPRASLALLLLLAVFCVEWSAGGHAAQHESPLSGESCALCGSVQSLLLPSALAVVIAPLDQFAHPVSAPASVALGPDRGSPRSRAPPSFSALGA